MTAATDPFAEAREAWVHESINLMTRLSRMPMLWERAQRVKKGATPSEVVFEVDRVTLLRYQPVGPIRYRTPLLFVFALVNRPYILDLLPGKSVVEHFVKAGFDVYLVDWGKPTHADRHKTLDTYINGYMYDIIEYLRERCESDRVNVLGYCMGGAMSAMYAALHPRKLRNLIMLAAGIDFATREGLLNIWSNPDVFDVDQFVDAYGNCPAEFLQGAFLMMNPVSNLLAKPLGLIERADDDRFVDEFFTMETWLNDNIPIPGEVYRAYVKYLFQQNKLVKGEMPVGRHTVDLKKITCPVLNLMAERDDLVPCVQSEPFNDLVGSTDRRSIKFKAGHIGMAVGSKAQKELWPEVVRWLADRSEAMA